MVNSIQHVHLCMKLVGVSSIIYEISCKPIHKKCHKKNLGRDGRLSRMDLNLGVDVVWWMVVVVGMSVGARVVCTHGG